ncbi:MAG: FKBP-type peptidyl-prolyl cis-trans isomerase [Bacteroidales bacterium]|jgi:FKBP-type peptidyl-prolyl cis-trans isomerase SlyD|nr:FKBP-type peptidyl-prolyl cis-trans isomerase [Bacteroidales bacterium]
MQISDNKVVSLSYELRLDGKEGEIIEVKNPQQPLIFLYGTGALLPAFEQNIRHLQKGDEFAFLLKCDEAYGPATEEALIELPVSAFLVDGEIDHDLLVEGNAIPMVDSKGNQLSGIVAEIKKDTVMMDFNHPLAGDDLYFSGAVTDIREATAEELERGSVAGACCSSGDCGSCSDNCS